MVAVNQVGNALTGTSGTGAFAGTTSPSFTTPALGTPSAGVLSSCTGYAQSALTGLGTGVSTALGNNVTGSGGIALATSPTFVTPVLGAATATSISFGGTALANYVEGTFTPVFASAGGGTATYSTQIGRYTRIGNRCFFNIYLQLTGLPSAGVVSISGLPFTIANYGAGSIYATALDAGVLSPLIISLNGGGAVVSMYTFAAGNAAGLTVANCTATTGILVSGQYDI